MSDKTNEEKLRILQERLSAIKQKETTRKDARVEKNTPAAPIFEENLDNKQPIVDPPTQNNKGSFWKIIFFLIFFSFLGGFGYYFYTNDFKIDSTLDAINKDVSTSSEKISSLFGKNKKNKEVATEEVIDEEEDIEDEKEIKYNLDIPDKLIAITASFKDRRSAKAMVNDLKVKGFKCNYFFLPKKSNSKEKVYKVFIGPYENEEETNQWTKNLEVDFEIVKL